MVEQVADKRVEKGTTLHKPIRNNETKRGRGRKPLRIQDPTTNPVHMASSVKPSDEDSFSSEPPPPLYLTSNPVPSFSGPSFGSDLKLRGCGDADVLDVLGVWRRFVVGTGSPGARLGPE